MSDYARSTTIFRAPPQLLVGAILSAMNLTGIAGHGAARRGLGSGHRGNRHLRPLARGADHRCRAAREGRTKPLLSVDRQGLLIEGMKGLQPFQANFAQKRERIVGWNSIVSAGHARTRRRWWPTLVSIRAIWDVRPTACLLRSRRAHDGATATQRPIIFPLSTWTGRSEATPQDLLAWTEDRAVVGTGSPFPPIIRGWRAVSDRPGAQFLRLFQVSV